MFLSINKQYVFFVRKKKWIFKKRRVTWQTKEEQCGSWEQEKKLSIAYAFLLHSIYCLSSLFRLNICNKTLSINFILKCNDNCKERIQCSVFAPFSTFSLLHMPNTLCAAIREKMMTAVAAIYIEHNADKNN